MLSDICEAGAHNSQTTLAVGHGNDVSVFPGLFFADQLVEMEKPDHLRVVPLEEGGVGADVCRNLLQTPNRLQELMPHGSRIAGPIQCCYDGIDVVAKHISLEKPHQNSLFQVRSVTAS